MGTYLCDFSVSRRNIRIFQNRTSKLYRNGHALNCVSRDTGDGIYNQWAMQLAKVAHAAFTYMPPEGEAKRMYWKMSIDLSRPLVYSMGQHDPLDGLITYHQLETTAKRFLNTPPELSLLEFATHNRLNLPAEYRLAFRELGLAIGLHTISRMQKCIEQHPENYSNANQLSFMLRKLSHFCRLHEFIENFWLEHADINNVMLATSLAPDGYFQL